VLRGGSWDDFQGFARCAGRNWNAPGDRFYFIGFRVAASHGIPPWPEMSRVYGRVAEAIIRRAGAACSWLGATPGKYRRAPPPVVDPEVEAWGGATF